MPKAKRTGQRNGVFCVTAPDIMPKIVMSSQRRMVLIRRGCTARHGTETLCIQDNHLLLTDGTKLPVVKSGGSVTESKGGSEMPVVRGMVATNMVNTLRDMRCSGVVVRKKFVNDGQYTGKYYYILLFDNTVRQVPIVEEPRQLDNVYKDATEDQRGVSKSSSSDNRKKASCGLH